MIVRWVSTSLLGAYTLSIFASPRHHPPEGPHSNAQSIFELGQQWRGQTNIQLWIERTYSPIDSISLQSTSFIFHSNSNSHSHIPMILTYYPHMLFQKSKAENQSQLMPSYLSPSLSLLPNFHVRIRATVMLRIECLWVMYFLNNMCWTGSLECEPHGILYIIISKWPERSRSELVFSS